MHIGAHQEPDGEQWYVSRRPNQQTVLETKVAAQNTFIWDKREEGGRRTSCTSLRASRSTP
jgi:hypothetical protein